MRFRGLAVLGAIALPVIGGAYAFGNIVRQEYREGSETLREVRGTLGSFYRDSTFRNGCGRPLVVEMRGDDGKLYRANFNTFFTCSEMEAAENELRSPQFSGSGQRMSIRGNIFVQDGDAADVYYGMGRGFPCVLTAVYDNDPNTSLFYRLCSRQE